MNIRPADSLEEVIITVVIGALFYIIFFHRNNLLNKVLDWVIK